MYVETSMSSSASWAKALGVFWKADDVGRDALVKSSAIFGSQQNRKLPSEWSVVFLLTRLVGVEEDIADLRERLFACTPLELTSPLPSRTDELPLSVLQIPVTDL